MNVGITIALDAMGGDYGPSVVVPSALEVLQEFQNLVLILVGERDLLQTTLESYRYTLKNFQKVSQRVMIEHASQRVEMDDPPAMALRNKRDSSMRVAINLVHHGKASACVSAGNTGALMAIARYVLKTLPGIDRPAITTAIPSLKGHTYMLDLGANVDCTAQHLFQFALMGSILCTALDNVESPRVGLLNVGEEIIKGNDQVKEAAKLLKENHDINYIGYVEGNDIFLGDVDIVVCDGFVGNVALKSVEGAARMIKDIIKQEFTRNLLTKLAALVSMPAIKGMQTRLDPRQYNGASLLGLQGIVVKSHGGADIMSFANAIRMAILEVEKKVPVKTGQLLAQLIDSSRSLDSQKPS